MKKRYNVRLITSRRSYSTLELAELLHAHPQTIREWRGNGMTPIDESVHNYLYLGSEVRRYLSKCQIEQKVKLAENEFYCMRCKGARLAREITEVVTGVKVGLDKPSIIRVGKCRVCGCKVRRFAIKPLNILAEGKGINLELFPPLYHSLASGEDDICPKRRKYGRKTRR